MRHLLPGQTPQIGDQFFSIYADRSACASGQPNTHESTRSLRRRDDRRPAKLCNGAFLTGTAGAEKFRLMNARSGKIAFHPTGRTVDCWKAGLDLTRPFRRRRGCSLLCLLGIHVCNPNPLDVADRY